MGFTLTGERFSWVTIGDPVIATALMPSWSNTTASLPAEWQLRFMYSGADTSVRKREEEAPHPFHLLTMGKEYLSEGLGTSDREKRDGLPSRSLSN
jgi:hypothetical protein